MKYIQKNNFFREKVKIKLLLTFNIFSWYNIKVVFEYQLFSFKHFISVHKFKGQKFKNLYKNTCFKLYVLVMWDIKSNNSLHLSKLSLPVIELFDSFVAICEWAMRKRISLSEIKILIVSIINVCCKRKRRYQIAFIHTCKIIATQPLTNGWQHDEWKRKGMALLMK